MTARKKNQKDSKEKKKEETKPKWHEDLKSETKHSILAVVCFALAVIFILIAFGKGGIIGASIYNTLDKIFGAGFFLIPLLSFLLAVSFLTSLKTRILAVNLMGGAVFLASSLGLLETVFGKKGGGYFGYFVNFPLLKFFDIWITLILLSAFLLISILMIFNVSFKLRGRKNLEEAPQKSKTAETNLGAGDSEESQISGTGEKEAKKKDESAASQKVFESGALGLNIFKKNRKPSLEIDSVSLPPVDLLEGDRGKPNSGDIKANTNIIKRTLQNFGIEVEMGEVNIGPSVTQYTLKPAQGVKLAKITSLTNDLALALAAHPIRIEAPIPGRSLIGIEIPNRANSLVGLKTLIYAPEFQTAQSSLILALGRGVSGKAVYADLGKMPHLLIAGATGSGKSVCIHALITSLLYRNTAANLRFLIVDPKRVELAVYGGLPHLLCPPIVEAKKTILALRWATKEMERRYEVLSAIKVRDINSYKETILKNGKEDEMPYIVIIIDELADIMTVYPRELEASVVRLAQMSRAVGIHLVVSTQRPSVEVITGLIKANITSRIAFQVASQIDSRTILDMAGAEKLLGNGDMLFLSGDSSKPRRIQGAFVSEAEIKRVSSYLEEEAAPELGPADLELNERENGKNGESVPAAILEPRLTGSFSGTAAVQNDKEKFLTDSIFEKLENGEEDELYEEARQLVIEAKKASASYLQRRLKIGYARAARLLDDMEAKGVVGPVDGAKPREVYISNTNVI